ncbi:hypothetical protein HK107_09440 [Parvularcula sp. ZS-1/3]|uniref:Uncharacterized protein n=1 Tax=Parvularcula mediterranea TaxID=2732508 RepID=A0A7Y3RNJ4_9PROT|nr:hypothetical protein [Parvularcula mediterranea]NNU16542.1 hypothetical protein [Parvularcula mediterranea]
MSERDEDRSEEADKLRDQDKDSYGPYGQHRPERRSADKFEPGDDPEDAV